MVKTWDVSELEKIKELTVCPECGSDAYIQDSEAGEIVCENCGVVVSTNLFDHGPEWRAFNEEQREKRTRVGSPLTITFHDKGLSTMIGWRSRDAYGRPLNPERKAQIYRLRKWNRRSKVSGASQRSLTYALTEITKIAYKLNLPKNVLETAAVIYRKLIQKRLLRGRSIRGVTAAALYMACRQCNVVRSLEEVGEAANISKKECARCYRFLLKKFDSQVPKVEVKNYVSKCVTQLALSGDVEHVALRIVDLATGMRLISGRSPAGIAAAATYIASLLSNEHRTQAQIADKAQVTEVTIRNRYKEIVQKLSMEINL